MEYCTNAYNIERSMAYRLTRAAIKYYRNKNQKINEEKDEEKKIA